MSEIHYFPRYSQKENFVTNNTLLFLLRVHQYSRLKFQKLIEELCVDEPNVQLSTSWLHFQQQKATERSVLDGFISQDSIKIAVETKRADSFDFSQLENHLSVFKNEQHKLLIMLSPKENEIPSREMESIRELAKRRNIQILHTSFEEIVRKTRGCLSNHDEEMHALVDDYESFCSESGLLPEDKYLVFVPPCGQSFEDNYSLRLYYCPASWSRRKARYIGIYRDKSVRAIGEITKIVSCDANQEQQEVTLREWVKGSGELTQDEKQRILVACKNAPGRGWDVSTGHKFYLCDELVETDFKKQSSGGIPGHRYLDLRDFLRTDFSHATTTDLASALRHSKWQ